MNAIRLDENGLYIKDSVSYDVYNINDIINYALARKEFNLIPKVTDPKILNYFN